MGAHIDLISEADDRGRITGRVVGAGMRNQECCSTVPLHALLIELRPVEREVPLGATDRDDRTGHVVRLLDFSARTIDATPASS